jgi:hypothetical protein
MLGGRPRAFATPVRAKGRDHPEDFDCRERRLSKFSDRTLQEGFDSYTPPSPLGELPGGVAEWSKAAVLKTAERKLRGFESLLLRRL